MRHSLLFSALFSLFLSGTLYGQELLFKNAPVPDLKAVLQTGNSKNWQASVNGKIIVLEFWATWCTPCLANLAHLNELSEHFADSGVQFISITDEPEEKIRTFLGKRKMNGWVGIDSGGTTFKRYKVEGRPTTFVIDKSGIIQYRGIPQLLTAEVITGILAGSYRQSQYTSQTDIKTLGGFAPGDDPVFTAHFNPKETKVMQQFIFRHAVGSGGMGYKTVDGMVGITLLSRSVPQIIAFTCGLPSYKRVLNLSSVADSTLWDIVFSRSRNCDLPKALTEINEGIEQSLSIRIRDTTISGSFRTPVFAPGARVMKQKDIDFNSAETHSFWSLKQLFDDIEQGSGPVIIYPVDAEEQYVDVFEILPVIHKMKGGDLLAWLEKNGVTLREERSSFAGKVITNE